MEREYPEVFTDPGYKYIGKKQVGLAVAHRCIAFQLAEDGYPKPEFFEKGLQKIAKVLDIDKGDITYNRIKHLATSLSAKEFI